MEEYFISFNGSQTDGPFTKQELNKMNIDQHTLVWNKITECWQPAKEFRELSDLFLMPPLPVGTQVHSPSNHRAYPMPLDTPKNTFFLKKRTVLSIIIGSLCFMNVFIPIVGDDITYLDLFKEVISEDRLSFFWKFIFMSPTLILGVLTVLHIMEPKSEAITRNHLAIAGISGFLLYLILFGIMLLAFTVLTSIGDVIVSLFDDNYQGSKTGILSLGWSPIFYPILFLSYVLVHRIMRYN